ncbi:MAG: BolA/IbaG family iron-sulfur metabolism protein [Gammaproteobacteria bacterium]|nr:BolA/IbaG family iron-sulfur metabolism protein [Gammaproteobacteria bacterium]
MVKPEDIREWIEHGLQGSKVEIDGDGQHFSAVIVYPGFAGKSKVQQHQMVYQALGDKMKAEIHALSMRTLTPEQWSAEHGSIM